MSRGPEEQAPEVAADFPYRTLMTHPVWAIIDAALADLESNDDLQLQTARRYIIGYLVQQLAESGQIPPAIAFRPDAPNSSQPNGYVRAQPHFPGVFYATIPSITSPCTSVSRMSLPPQR
jgi:hypothetical protein